MGNIRIKTFGFGDVVLISLRLSRIKLDFIFTYVDNITRKAALHFV